MAVYWPAGWLALGGLFDGYLFPLDDLPYVIRLYGLHDDCLFVTLLCLARCGTLNEWLSSCM